MVSHYKKPFIEDYLYREFADNLYGFSFYIHFHINIIFHIRTSVRFLIVLLCYAIVKRIAKPLPDF